MTWLCRTSHSYLWCDVVRGAAEGACGYAFIHVLLTHAKVGDLDVALRVQHHVVKLQIPVTSICTHTFYYMYKHFDITGLLLSLRRCLNKANRLCRAVYLSAEHLPSDVFSPYDACIFTST